MRIGRLRACIPSDELVAHKHGGHGQRRGHCRRKVRHLALDDGLLVRDDCIVPSSAHVFLSFRVSVSQKLAALGRRGNSSASQFAFAQSSRRRSSTCWILTQVRPSHISGSRRHCVQLVISSRQTKKKTKRRSLVECGDAKMQPGLRRWATRHKLTISSSTSPSSPSNRLTKPTPKWFSAMRVRFGLGAPHSPDSHGRFRDFTRRRTNKSPSR